MYDSTKETKLHIQKVSDYLDKCVLELSERQTSHDWDKIEDPVEKELFDTYKNTNICNIFLYLFHTIYGRLLYG